MSDERKLSERFEAAAKAATPGPWLYVHECDGFEGGVEQYPYDRLSIPEYDKVREADDHYQGDDIQGLTTPDIRFIALCGTERDRILEALRRDEDPRRAIADRLLAICEQPSEEERAILEHVVFNDGDGFAAILALAEKRDAM